MPAQQARGCDTGPATHVCRCRLADHELPMAQDDNGHGRLRLQPHADPRAMAWQRGAMTTEAMVRTAGLEPALPGESGF
jgi:hypothetical protein